MSILSLKSYLSIFATVLVLGQAVSAAQAADLPDFTQLVEQASPAVVNISTTQKLPDRKVNQQMPDLEGLPPMLREFFERGMPPQQRSPRGDRQREAQSLGSGFIISSDGYILTNNHVIADADEILVRLADRSEMKAKLIGTDPRSDVALLKIDGKDLPVLKLGKSQDLKAGQWVVAIGSPFGFDHTVTQGIVSAVGRSLPNENYVPFIQTDVPINPGNSGGPLFNLNGELADLHPFRWLHGRIVRHPYRCGDGRFQSAEKRWQGQPRLAGRGHPGSEQGSGRVVRS
jgi:serine protease Do